MHGCCVFRHRPIHANLLVASDIIVIVFLHLTAPLVKFSPLSEMDRNKFVEVGNPIVLYCELSDPTAPVHWYKNGVELQSTEGLHIQSEGTMRRIVIQSAEFSHSGVYCCDAIDDVIRFNVEVEGEWNEFFILVSLTEINHLDCHINPFCFCYFNI